MSASLRDEDLRAFLLNRGLREIPKILTLQDRTPHSVTYGCFDRNYWHYRIIDFPSGMAQEFVLPLALAWATNTPDNEFAGKDCIRDWAVAGIAFAARSAHADGSCDDYYPHERAAGATAFSLYATLRAIEILDVDHRPFLSFLTRRAEWLHAHRESGRLSNHEALIAATLFRLSRLIGNADFARMGAERLARLLDWQSEEGWFAEYEGCDPGYLTLTVAMLAEIHEIHPDQGLRQPLTAAVDFLARIQPPDGWFGGEWASRNTHNYFPHGLEACGRWLPQALAVNTRAVAGLIRAEPCYSDDHILGHHCWSYLLAARNWVATRAPLLPPADGRELFPEAGLVIDRKNGRTLLCATKKGGAFRLYDGDTLNCADTGLSLQVDLRGRRRVAVCHLWSDDNQVAIGENELTVQGWMGWAKTQAMTPFRNVVLRLVMTSVGRFFPDLVRLILQKLLISGHKRAPFRFTRRLSWTSRQILVADEIESGEWASVVAAGIGSAQTSIYAVMSRVFHPSQLVPWQDCSEALRDVGEDGRLRVRRTL